MTVVFNFKQQFAGRVADGDKLQTIRAERKDGRRPGIGETVKLYTGLRTKQTKLLATGVVDDCFAVRFDMANDQVYVDDVCLSSREADFDIKTWRCAFTRAFCRTALPRSTDKSKAEGT